MGRCAPVLPSEESQQRCRARWQLHTPGANNVDPGRDPSNRLDEILCFTSLAGSPALFPEIFSQQAQMVLNPFPQDPEPPLIFVDHKCQRKVSGICTFISHPSYAAGKI